VRSEEVNGPVVSSVPDCEGRESDHIDILRRDLAKALPVPVHSTEASRERG
jgi:hypothetical protein